MGPYLLQFSSLLFHTAVASGCSVGYRDEARGLRLADRQILSELDNLENAVRGDGDDSTDGDKEKGEEEPSEALVALVEKEDATPSNEEEARPDPSLHPCNRAMLARRLGVCELLQPRKVKPLLLRAVVHQLVADDLLAQPQRLEKECCRVLCVLGGLKKKERGGRGRERVF